MSRPLAILRPEPGWTTTAQAARDLDLTVIGQPIFTFEAASWAPPAQSFDALLVGSATAFRVGGESLARYRTLPVLAVGNATAQAGRAAGFQVALAGAGGLQALLDQAGAQWPRLLRLAGEERVTLKLRPGQSLVESIVYRSRAVPFDPMLAAQLARDYPVIALHSAAAARHLAEECQRLGVRRAGLDLLALGPRIAAAAGPGWAGVHSADQPSDAALLSKAAALCK